MKNLFFVFGLFLACSTFVFAQTANSPAKTGEIVQPSSSPSSAEPQTVIVETSVEPTVAEPEIVGGDVLLGGVPPPPVVYETTIVIVSTRRN